VLGITLPQSEVEFAKARVRYFAMEWWGETPLRLHVPRAHGDDGAPLLHPDFVSYLDDALHEKRESGRHSRRVELETPRRRVTKAFRLLRRRAPKEFDVLYCMCVIDQVGRSLKRDDFEGLTHEFETSLRRTVRRMNQRARKRGEPELAEDDLLVLVVSGIRKLTLWSG
jgi:hypothetical protein